MDLIQNEDYAADSCAISPMAFLLYSVGGHSTASKATVSIIQVHGCQKFGLLALIAIETIDPQLVASYTWIDGQSGTLFCPSAANSLH